MIQYLNEVLRAYLRCWTRENNFIEVSRYPHTLTRMVSDLPDNENHVPCVTGHCPKRELCKTDAVKHVHFASPSPPTPGAIMRLSISNLTTPLRGSILCSTKELHRGDSSPIRDFRVKRSEHLGITPIQKQPYKAVGVGDQGRPSRAESSSLGLRQPTITLYS